MPQIVLSFVKYQSRISGSYRGNIFCPPATCHTPYSIIPISIFCSPSNPQILDKKLLLLQVQEKTELLLKLKMLKQLESFALCRQKLQLDLS